MNDLQVILSAVEPELVEAWEAVSADLDWIRVHRGSILDLECDAVVSPANSFGFMDGGIDMGYSQHFGWHVQEGLQSLIASRHSGELLVGTAEIVETGNKRIPFLIAAPTMRVPMILRESVNPYLAARAVFLLIRDGVFSSGQHNGEPIADHVRTVAFPGLGTGAGVVAPGICARQFRAAVQDVVLQTTPYPESWIEAGRRHQLLFRDRAWDLQFEDDE